MSSIPQTLLYGGYGIRKGMWTMSWLHDMLGESLIQNTKAQDLSPEDLLDKKASCVPPGCNELVTVLDWPANPWEPYKRGIMIDFDSSMDYVWIYRPILESVALTLKNSYDNMCHGVNHSAKHVIITGGGSNSDLSMQIFADVFNLPAHRNAINGCVSLGAAIDTAVGLGLYLDYITAVDEMVRVKNIFIPIESNTERYNAMNEGIFKNLTKHTDVILRKSYEAMHGELGNMDSIQSWSSA